MVPYIGTPTVICSCGRLIPETDGLFCDGCGDVTCFDCTVECNHCTKQYCCNCSDNNYECIRCSIAQEPTFELFDKAYLVIDGEATPIKNSHFMVERTSIENARDITLKLDGRQFQFSHKTLCRKEDSENFDYFIYFKEIEPPPTSRDRLKSLIDDHDARMKKMEDAYDSWVPPFNEGKNVFKPFNEIDFDLSSLAENLPWNTE